MQPVDLYYWPTPNGWKIAIFLEESETPYNVKPVDITSGDQFKPEYIAINPNSKMPSLVDPEGPDGQAISMFESGAILLYLAEKTGKFLPESKRDRLVVTQWLMFQVGHIGPMLGQAHHFRQYAPESIPYAIERYTQEAGRLYSVLDRRLGEVEYVAKEYSIADMAIFPWLVSSERKGQNLSDYPNLKRWFDTINSRPAVQRGLSLLKEETQKIKNMSEEEKAQLFGYSKNS